jgi:predicted O-methyltransferase YrrM
MTAEQEQKASRGRDDLEEVHTITKDVDGWLTRQEGALLYRLAGKTTGLGVIVEIGSWQGKSTIYIARALKATGKKTRFYAVDPHVGSEEHQEPGKKVWTFDMFEKNIKRADVAEFVTPTVLYSADFAGKLNDAVELIFIDGAHDYASVEIDIKAWLPKVVEGGTLAFHDTYAGGDPYRVLRSYVYRSRQVSRVRRVDSITYVRTCAHNTLRVYFYNLAYMYLQDLKVLLYKNKVCAQLFVFIKRVSRS